MNVVLRFRCGHTATANFVYPTAVRNWKRYAKEEDCGACRAAQERKASGVQRKVAAE